MCIRDRVKYGHFLKMTSSCPLILARVNLGEDNRGFLKTKFKRHRWYSNLLKSNDPVIVSSGWRRYQTMMVFGTEDQNERLRYSADDSGISSTVPSTTSAKESSMATSWCRTAESSSCKPSATT